MNALGTTLLCGSLVLAGISAVAWVVSVRGDVSRRWVRLGRVTAFASAAQVLTAVVVIEVALLRHDTSIAYVERVSGPDLPTYFRITSLWSAVEGSLLLWLATLCVVLLFGLRTERKGGRTSHRLAVAILCLVVAVFAVTALMASPFAVAEASASSRPSPLLQDHVAMGMHPPLLYAGFAGLAMPYAMSVGALVTRQVDHHWANVVRRWNLVSWVLLSAGVVLGAWWSYAVLGWGGYWAWDPVENASLMPWLTATALLHAVGLRTRSGNWRAWAVCLSGAGFVLVLLAGFLTRSGVVESIHAFSVSPLGPVLLGILLLALASWVWVVIARRDVMGPGEPGAGLDRRTAMQVNHVLLVLTTGIVLIGTLLPTLVLALTGDRVSVGPPWYQRTVAPVALVLLVAMAAGPWLSQRHEPPRSVLHRMRAALIAAAMTIGVVGLVINDLWLAVVGSIAVFVLASLVLKARNRRTDRYLIGGLLAHFGVAAGAVAVLAGGYATTTEDALEAGASMAVGDATLTLIGLDVWDEGRRNVVEAEIVLGQDERYLGTVHPQLRWYEQESTMLAGPEIRSEAFRDVYVTLLDYEPSEGLATVRLTVTPLVSWMWAAAGVTIVGGCLTAWPRRRARDRSRPPPPIELTSKTEAGRSA